MTPRQGQALAALESLGPGWHTADMVWRRLPAREWSTQGLGQVLSHLAGAGHCRRRLHGGFMWEYQALP